MSAVYGIILLICAIIDHRHGDGVMAANIEMTGGFICLAIYHAANKIGERGA